MSALFKPCVGLTTYFTSVGWCGVMWAPIGPFSMTFRGQPTSSSSLYPIRTNLGPIHRSDEIIRHGIRCSMMCIYFRRGDTTLSSTTTISLLTIRHVAYDIVLWWIFFLIRRKHRLFSVQSHLYRFDLQDALSDVGRRTNDCPEKTIPLGWFKFAYHSCDLAHVITLTGSSVFPLLDAHFYD